MSRLPPFLLALCVALLCVASSTSGYKVNKNKISVSGVSSGGYFANQYHVAFSSEVMGAAIFAAGPFYCSGGSLTGATTRCMSVPMSPPVDSLISSMKTFAQEGKIDNLSGLLGDKVYIYSGEKDSLVNPIVAKAGEKVYKNFVNASDVMTEYSIPSAHCMPSDSFGGECGTLASPFINNCGYDGAGIALQHLYGSLRPRTAALPSNLIQVDQPAAPSLGSKAYVYVPTGCKSSNVSMFVDASCKLRQDCSGNGDCVNAVCKCDDGWEGVKCDQKVHPPCQTRSDCSDHGDCINQLCQCDEGFTGPKCDQLPKACQLRSDCSNHGDCVDEVCKCDEGWAGAECEKSVGPSPSDGCALHIAFHGCQQTEADIGNTYYEHAGYNEWAEANNIIVVYPQAKKSFLLPSNPEGCWDWWGYSGKDFAFKTGKQLNSVKQLVEKLMN